MAAAIHHDYVLHYYLGIYKCSYFTHSLSSRSCVQPIGLKTDPYNGMRGIPLDHLAETAAANCA
jgi:hypothetical protein